MTKQLKQQMLIATVVSVQSGKVPTDLRLLPPDYVYFDDVWDGVFITVLLMNQKNVEDVRETLLADKRLRKTLYEAGEVVKKAVRNVPNARGLTTEIIDLPDYVGAIITTEKLFC